MGPNRSFPVSDCPHFVAALRLLNRAKVSDSTKAKIRACVERKGKTLGCNKSTDSAYVWLRDEAGNFIDRLSDFDLSTLMDLVSKKAEAREIGSLPIFVDMKDKIDEASSLQSENTDLNSVITDQQQEIERLTNGFKKSVSYINNIRSLIGGDSTIQDTSDVFVTSEDKDVETCLKDLEEIITDEKLNTSLQTFISKDDEEIITDEKIEDPTAESNVRVENTNVYKDETIKQIKEKYKEIREQEGGMQASLYLRKMKMLKQVPEDFSIMEG